MNIIRKDGQDLAQEDIMFLSESGFPPNTQLDFFELMAFINSEFGEEYKVVVVYPQVK